MEQKKAIVRDYKVLTEKISPDNVAELIAMRETRALIGYMGYHAEKAHKRLCRDIFGKHEPGYIFSDSYDLVQSVALFLCGHYEEYLDDVPYISKRGKPRTIKIKCFDSMMIGLTATPRNDIHKSTYRVFDLADDMPNYEYDVVKGVKDGYLTYYRAYDRTPDILKNGLVYNDLSEDEKEQYEDLFTEDDGTLPEKIEGRQFYSVITNRDTIREVLKDLMEEGLRVNNGDTLGKTIIFARDHNHALLIQEEFRHLYPELCNPNPRNGVDYCVIIDNKIKYNEILQREFKEKQDIRIVISVDMMDTGVDIPEIVNLVFFKKVLSKIKFWQMIGRGTRICIFCRVIHMVLFLYHFFQKQFFLKRAITCDLRLSYPFKTFSVYPYCVDNSKNNLLKIRKFFDCRFIVIIFQLRLNLYQFFFQFSRQLVHIRFVIHNFNNAFLTRFFNDFGNFISN